MNSVARLAVRQFSSSVVRSNSNVPAGNFVYCLYLVLIDVCLLAFRILQSEDLPEDVQCRQRPESSPEGRHEGRHVVQRLRRPHLHRWRLLGQDSLRHGLPPEIDP